MKKIIKKAGRPKKVAPPPKPKKVKAMPPTEVPPAPPQPEPAVVPEPVAETNPLPLVEGVQAIEILTEREMAILYKLENGTTVWVPKK